MAEHIVEYHNYCNKCRYKDVRGTDDPCHECLSTPVREDSRKPIKFWPLELEKEES